MPAEPLTRSPQLEVQRLHAMLQPPPKSAKFQLAESALLKARRERAQIALKLRDAIFAHSIDERNTMAGETIGTLSSELQRAEASVGSASTILSAQREKYGHEFRSAMAPHLAAAKTILSEILDVLDDGVGALLDAQASAVNAHVVAPRFLQSAPHLAESVRQMRALISGA